MKKLQVQNPLALASGFAASEMLARVSVTWETASAAGNTEWTEAQIWQWSPAFASGWECASCTVESSTSSNMQSTAAALHHEAFQKMLFRAHSRCPLPTLNRSGRGGKKAVSPI